MVKNHPSIFPCTRRIYLIFLWNKAVRIVVMGTGPLGSLLLVLHTLPQAPGVVWPCTQDYPPLGALASWHSWAAGAESQKCLQVYICTSHLTPQPTTGRRI